VNASESPRPTERLLCRLWWPVLTHLSVKRRPKRLEYQKLFSSEWGITLGLSRSHLGGQLIRSCRAKVEEVVRNRVVFVEIRPEERGARTNHSKYARGAHMSIFSGKLTIK